jgi:hypothetical protein
MGRVLLTLTLVTASLAGAESSFAVVVHRSNPTNSLRRSDLRAYFSGDTRQWPQGMKLVLVERDLQSDVFRFLLQHVLSITAGNYKRHLANIEFRGETPVMVKILNSDAAACKFVFNVPGSIALVATSSLAIPECGAVQLVRVDGKLPGEDKYGLQ